VIGAPPNTTATLSVTPAQAGAQSGKVLCPASLGPGLRRDDESETSK
jgi:hypothetical protein